MTVGNFNKILDQYPNLATIIKTKLNQLGFNYALIESCSRYYSAGFLTSYVNPNLHMDRLNIDSFVRILDVKPIPHFPSQNGPLD